MLAEPGVCAPTAPRWEPPAARQGTATCRCWPAVGAGMQRTRCCLTRRLQPRNQARDRSGAPARCEQGGTHIARPARAAPPRQRAPGPGTPARAPCSHLSTPQAARRRPARPRSQARDHSRHPWPGSAAPLKALVWNGLVQSGLPRGGQARAHPLQRGCAIDKHREGHTLLHVCAARRQDRPRRRQACSQAIYVAFRVPARRARCVAGPTGRRLRT